LPDSVAFFDFVVLLFFFATEILLDEMITREPNACSPALCLWVAGATAPDALANLQLAYQRANAGSQPALATEFNST
jgi:hypothetical protein